jgi:hypothetical protein
MTTDGSLLLDVPLRLLVRAKRRPSSCDMGRSSQIQEYPHGEVAQQKSRDQVFRRSSESESSARRNDYDHPIGYVEKLCGTPEAEDLTLRFQSANKIFN